MKTVSNGFTSIEQVADQYFSNVSPKKTNSVSEISFDDILQSKLNSGTPLKFSKHAAMRLSNRNIQLTDNQNIRLEEGVEKADAKGIRESLVLVDSLAFIVNVPNRTVVTAMDQADADSNIFTNIDGAVIM